MNAYYIAYQANTEDSREALLFEAECRYALLTEYEHIMDITGTVFTLIESDGDILLEEVDPNKDDDESVLSNAYQVLAALDESILDFIGNTKLFDEKSANILLTLAHAKKTLQEAH